MKRTSLLIDGYNVIHKIPELSSYLHKSLEQSREKLALYLQAWKQKTHFKGSISAVFDGRSQNFIDTHDYVHGIQFVFSYQGSDADSHIITMLKKGRGNTSFTVITDDNFIANHCRVYGAVHKPVAYLLPDSRQKHTTRQDRQDRKDIPARARNDINTYLKKTWGIE